MKANRNTSIRCFKLGQSLTAKQRNENIAIAGRGKKHKTKDFFSSKGSRKIMKHTTIQKKITQGNTSNPSLENKSAKAY